MKAKSLNFSVVCVELLLLDLFYRHDEMLGIFITSRTVITIVKKYGSWPNVWVAPRPKSSKANF